MQKLKNLNLFLLVLLLLGCSKVEVPKGTPRCIKKHIREIEKENKGRQKATVWKWTVNGKEYYFFPVHSCCDKTSTLYDSKCNVVCHPDGGIGGGGDGRCPDWYENGDSIVRTKIWEDPR